jgi:hypothetical protein
MEVYAMAEEPQWGRAGRSFRRAQARAMVKELQKPQTPQSLLHRLLDFIEQPLFTLSLGVVGGIVGVLLYAPILVLCGVCVILAFHRAKVVSEEDLWVQVPTYVVLSALVVGSLYGLHIVIEKKLAEANTTFSQLVASAVVKILPKTANVPNAQSPVAESTQSKQKERNNEFEWGGFHEIPDTFAVTLGDITVEMKMVNLRKFGKLIPVSTNGVTPIIVTPDKSGDPVFNFTAWAGGGPITIENNKVRISDPLLDRNFSKNALEVIGTDGVPVFQVIRENASHITVYGIFWPNVLNSSGLPTVWCFDNKHQLLFGRTECPDDFKLKPIFKYPAWKYPGEYAE